MGYEILFLRLRNDDDKKKSFLKQLFQIRKKQIAKTAKLLSDVSYKFFKCTFIHLDMIYFRKKWNALQQCDKIKIIDTLDNHKNN